MVYLVPIAAWVAAYALTYRLDAMAAARARRYAAVLVAVMAIASIAMLALPIVELVHGFKSVAAAAPSDKAAVLDRSIDAAHPRLALLCFPMLIAGVARGWSTRRRLRARAQEQAAAAQAFD